MGYDGNPIAADILPRRACVKAVGPAIASETSYFVTNVSGYATNQAVANSRLFESALLLTLFIKAR